MNRFSQLLLFIILISLISQETRADRGSVLKLGLGIVSVYVFGKLIHYKFFSEEAKMKKLQKTFNELGYTAFVQSNFSDKNDNLDAMDYKIGDALNVLEFINKPKFASKKSFLKKEFRIILNEVNLKRSEISLDTLKNNIFIQSNFPDANSMYKFLYFRYGHSSSWFLVDGYRELQNLMAYHVDRSLNLMQSIQDLNFMDRKRILQVEFQIMNKEIDRLKDLILNNSEYKQQLIMYNDYLAAEERQRRLEREIREEGQRNRLMLEAIHRQNSSVVIIR